LQLWLRRFNWATWYSKDLRRQLRNHNGRGFSNFNRVNRTWFPFMNSKTSSLLILILMPSLSCGIHHRSGPPSNIAESGHAQVPTIPTFIFQLLHSKAIYLHTVARAFPWFQIHQTSRNTLIIASSKYPWMPGYAIQTKINWVYYYLRVRMRMLSIDLFSQYTLGNKEQVLTIKSIVSWTTFGMVSTLVRLVSVVSQSLCTQIILTIMILYTLDRLQRGNIFH